jgi:hypothetical protein
MPPLPLQEKDFNSLITIPHLILFYYLHQVVVTGPVADCAQ